MTACVYACLCLSLFNTFQSVNPDRAYIAFIRCTRFWQKAAVADATRRCCTVKVKWESAPLATNLPIRGKLMYGCLLENHHFGFSPQKKHTPVKRNLKCVSACPTKVTGNPCEGLWRAKL